MLRNHVLLGVIDVPDHKLPDSLEPDLKVVFVGTAAGKRSAELGHYYAGHGNRFWQTLYEVGLTPRLFQPGEFRELLPLGIGYGICKLLQEQKVMLRKRACLITPKVFATAFLLALPTLVAWSPCAAAQDKPPASFTVISPIFDQLVAFSQPSDFVPAFEDTNASQYIRESVPRGETVEHWTQMITVTGAQGLSANPEASPKGLAARIATGFKNACPDNFAAATIGDLEIMGHKAFAAIVGCGSVTVGDSTNSETALLLVIKGASDYYTIQWAQRTPASASKPTINDAIWTRRLDELGPIRLCPIVPGEKAPYPSCIEKK
jgi:hypothetical protein